MNKRVFYEVLIVVLIIVLLYLFAPNPSETKENQYAEFVYACQKDCFMSYSNIKDASDCALNVCFPASKIKYAELFGEADPSSNENYSESRLSKKYKDAEACIQKCDTHECWSNCLAEV